MPGGAPDCPAISSKISKSMPARQFQSVARQARHFFKFEFENSKLKYIHFKKFQFWLFSTFNVFFVYSCAIFWYIYTHTKFISTNYAPICDSFELIGLLRNSQASSWISEINWARFCADFFPFHSKWETSADSIILGWTNIHGWKQLNLLFYCVEFYDFIKPRHDLLCRVDV